MVSSYFSFRFEHHGRRARNSAVFANAPAVLTNENRGDQRNGDAMPDIGAKKRVGVNDGAAEQAEAHVVVRGHAQLRAERSLAAEQRSGARHVGSHSDGPEAQLIVRKQIAGEREKQRQNHEQDANAPIELARALVRAGHENAEHVQPDGHDHQVSGPAVHVAKELAEGDVVFEIENIAKGLNFCGVVIKHQQHARKHEHDEQIKSDAAHAPCVAVTSGVAIDLGRMDVEEKIVERGEGAVARLFVVLDTENRAIELGVFRLFEVFRLLASLHLERFAQLTRLVFYVFENARLAAALSALIRHFGGLFPAELNLEHWVDLNFDF